MTNKEATIARDRIIKLDIGYTAELEEMKGSFRVGQRTGLRVIHKDSGNEVGFAATKQEADYIIGNMERSHA